MDRFLKKMFGGCGSVLVLVVFVMIVLVLLALAVLVRDVYRQFHGWLHPAYTRHTSL